jgi:hypothetical protein
MPSWVLKCNKCGFIITHSKIKNTDLPNYYLPLKPEVPPGGSELECPECKFKATYQRTGLMYQA